MIRIQEKGKNIRWLGRYYVTTGHDHSLYSYLKSNYLVALRVTTLVCKNKRAISGASRGKLITNPFEPHFISTYFLFNSSNGWDVNGKPKGFVRKGIKLLGKAQVNWMGHGRSQLFRRKRFSFKRVIALHSFWVFSVYLSSI